MSDFSHSPSLRYEEGVVPMAGSSGDVRFGGGGGGGGNARPAAATGRGFGRYN